MSTLKAHFQRKPILAVLYVLLVCLFFRILDIFVFRLDERLGEIILSKSLGFLLILLFLFYIGKSMRDIDLHRKKLFAGFQLAVLQVLLALSLCFGLSYFYIFLEGGKPFFSISDEYTLFTAIMFVFIGNLMNTLMEEGLFRGLMIKSFMTKMSFWKANTLQAFLFGLWHITWTIKQYTLGETDFGGMVINSLLYTIISFVMGFIMGYMYFKTGNLWTPIIWHMIWNCTMNLLIIKSVVFTDDSAVMSNSFIVFWIVFLAYSVISLFITKIFLNKRHSTPVSF